MHTFKSVQKIPISIHHAWDFFSSPQNLQLITPPEMRFEIRSEIPQKMHAGLFIHYYVRPVLNIRTKWTTEITHMKEPHFFVDEQRSGPYSIWHHQHHFKEINGGIEMTDIVDYKIPFGPMGKLANALFVKKKIEAIFEFRKKRLIELFGEMVG